MNRHFIAPQSILRSAVIILLLILVRGSSTAQISINVTAAPLTSLSVGDIDFKTSGSNNWFFTLSITYPGVHTVKMKAEITVNLADGTSFSPAATLITTPFVVTDNKTITNLEIGKTEIKTEKFEFETTAKDKLQQLALGTGKLPAGTYTFKLDVFDVSDAGTTDEKEFTYNLQNISRLDLITPQDMASVPTYFPFFQWIYDGSDVELSVFEKSPDSQSKEDALSSTPMLTVKTGDPGLPSGSQVFQYPAAGARPLLEGHTYVWQVKGLTSGTGGSGAVINSEIWEFTLGNSPSSSLYSNTTDSSSAGISSLLYLLPGLSQDLINQLLAGSYSLTGVILLDGVQLSAADVRNILNMLAANPDKVIGVEIVQ